MKKAVLLICLLISSYIVLAQTPGISNKITAVTQSSEQRKVSIKSTNDLLMLPENDIIINISRLNELSTFYRIIKNTSLEETFKSKGPLTIFAPNNQAFANLSAGKLDTLLSQEHKYDLIALITYHVIPGRITEKDITHAINTHKGIATFITLTGSRLIAKKDKDGNIILIDENGGQSTISKFNIVQSNGLIHLTTAVLIPRFKNI